VKSYALLILNSRGETATPLECPGPNEPRFGPELYSLQVPDDTQRSGERRLRTDRYQNTCKLSRTGLQPERKKYGAASMTAPFAKF
jgi:hypothetical protein